MPYHVPVYVYAFAFNFRMPILLSWNRVFCHIYSRMPANQPTDSQCDGEWKREWERAHTQALPMDGLFARISGIIVCLLQMEKKLMYVMS